MPVAGAIIGGAASIGGSLLAGSAAKSAANTQAAAAMHAADLQNQQYQQTRSDLAPYRNAGTGAVGSLADMLKPGYDYTTSPGYQFRFNEGQRAIDSSGAARGMAMSGGTLKDLIRFGQGIGADDYNQSFARNYQLASLGQNAAAMTGNAGAQAAGNAGNFLTQGANASAAGTIGQANAYQNGLGSLATLFQQPGLFGGGKLGSGGIVAPTTSLYNNASQTIAANPSIF